MHPQSGIERNKKKITKKRKYAIRRSHARSTRKRKFMCKTELDFHCLAFIGLAMAEAVQSEDFCLQWICIMSRLLHLDIVSAKCTAWTEMKQWRRIKNRSKIENTNFRFGTGTPMEIDGWNDEGTFGFKDLLLLCAALFQVNHWHLVCYICSSCVFIPFAQSV